MTSKEIEDTIKNLENLKEKLEYIENKETKDLNEEIYIKYIETESVNKVAQYINSKGYRIGNRKYISNDISDIIKQKNIISDLWLDDIAKKIFKKNKSSINKIYN